ncbi:uncharacterized protein LOC117245119 [Parus major]|uniref:uncharacterized protein LOC117245119 n=1 Tax=Parus major TaxID=9157 RepID=UPI001443D97D|nr:uncharacterized protein LOC117245119 [Parus major]
MQGGSGSLGRKFCPPPPCPPGSASQLASGVWPGAHIRPFRCLLSPFLSARASRGCPPGWDSLSPHPLPGGAPAAALLCALLPRHRLCKSLWKRDKITAGRNHRTALVGKDIILRCQRDRPSAGSSSPFQDVENSSGIFILEKGRIQRDVKQLCSTCEEVFEKTARAFRAVYGERRRHHRYEEPGETQQFLGSVLAEKSEQMVP